MKFCARCDNIRWVCEAHPDRPIFGHRACPCGAPGEPCPVCNRTELGNADDVPEMPDGYIVDAERCR